MAKLKTAVIGCGGRGRNHTEAYAQSKDTELAAFVDIVPERAKQLSEKYPGAAAYTDYRKMLREVKPDVVAMCTWPESHKRIVVAAARAGAKIINAEKPMAPTYGEALAMHRECEKAGAVCTYSHQRRFSSDFVKAKQLLKDGAIGELRRLEGSCPNMFDWGTHWFDMMFFFNDQVPASWVMAQIDVSRDSKVFGATLETSGVSFVKFQNEVNGLMITTSEGGEPPANALMDRGGFLVVGTEGTMLVHAHECPLELRRIGGKKPERPDLSKVEVLHPDPTIAGILDSIDAWKKGREPELASRKALMATELIFATYESSRSRGRIALPLKTKDSALLAMLADGQIGYAKSGRK
ncbi:MAG TPA: Gfo/Idh/MocA family oxidoreductase [Candidatus Brocadiia bacterium]|nr:Gfo/Idh/MocA family oxidoreductase [Candidatus Brocadiia bacterium]